MSTISSLATYVNTKTINRSVRKDTSNNPTGKITKITPHQMCARWTGKRCVDYFIEKQKDRTVSVNYAIGYDGDVACEVPEDYRAWTSSNRANDYKAVTVELSNLATDDSKNGWRMTDATIEAFIKLAIDICKRHEIPKLYYDGTPNGTLTLHEMFASTTCPGDYFKSRINYICDKVNAALNGEAVPEEIEGEAVEPYLVRVTDPDLNIRTGPGTNYAVVGQITDKGVYTIVEVSRNWGKLKSGAGWIALNLTGLYTPKDKAESEEVIDEFLPEYADNEGKIKLSDVRKVFRGAVGIDAVTDEMLAKYDLNGDGKISIAEARTILRKAVNIE